MLLNYLFITSAMPPARAMRGFLILLVFQRPSESSQARFAVAPVLWWRAFGFINSKQLKARHHNTNPYYPYRFRRFTIHDFRYTTLIG